MCDDSAHWFIVPPCLFSVFFLNSLFFRYPRPQVICDEENESHRILFVSSPKKSLACSSPEMISHCNRQGKKQQNLKKKERQRETQRKTARLGDDFPTEAGVATEIIGMTVKMLTHLGKLCLPNPKESFGQWKTLFGNRAPALGAEQSCKRKTSDYIILQSKRFPNGCRAVPERFPSGSRAVPERFSSGSRAVLKRKEKKIRPKNSW